MGAGVDLDRAVVLHRAGQLDAAEAIYRAVLAREPGNAGALHLLGMIELQRQNFAAAADLLAGAVAAEPRQAAMHFHLGSAQQELGRYAEAVASYDRAVALRPEFADAFNNRGNALKALGERETALASFDRAVALRPGFVIAQYNRGNLLMELGRPADALAGFDSALALKPDFAAALIARGNALRRLGRPDEAVVTYGKALAMRPQDVGVLVARGNAWSEAGRYDAAIADYDRALAIDPDQVEALYNRGNALRNGLRCEEALAGYASALRRAPGHAEAHAAKGWTLLLRGEFREGWREFEWRWQTRQMAPQRRDFAQPLWRGDTLLAGKTILLHAEQAFGDTIMLCRYAAELARRGADVILEVQPELRSLLAGIDGPTQVLARGHSLPAFDCHCPLMSLPLALATELATIPAKSPYIAADSAIAERWRRRLGDATRPRVGLAWFSANRARRDLAKRSLKLAMLDALPFDRVDFVSLQRDVAESDAPILAARRDIRHFGDELTDFAETAGLIAALDLVISIDTGVAHLAAAIGKPVWILLPFAPDWRWLLEREDSPWYPTARLFRQAAPDDWPSVVARVVRELAVRRP